MKPLKHTQTQKKEKKIEQAYIISSTDLEGKTEYLECVYKDYSESRKDARKIVDKINKEISFRNLVEERKQLPYMQEIAPDVWVSSTQKIMIEITIVKEVLKKRKIKTRFQTERIDHYQNSEIMLSA